MSKKVYQVGDEPTYSKVDKVYVVNPSEGGGGVADEVAWENVTDKPSIFPPTEHNHDDRYNTKEQVTAEIDFVRQQMIAGQGLVSATSTDEPGYLESKVDNTTVKVEGSELVVKSIDGLTVGAADISTWLAGTSDNVQTQIDDINDNLVAMTSGMHYRGRLETYAELQSIGNLNNGDLAVVLADESREGSRSMYVYNESNGVWEFIGAFTFSDRFTSLNDTPESFDGQDGKTLVARGGRVVLENVNYDDLDDKPESTITQIDDAVTKRHEHNNADSLAKLGVNSDGELTINGVVYAPKTEIPVKHRLYARRTGSEQSLTAGTTCIFNRKYGGEGIAYDANSGVFTLEAGKTYRVFVTASIKTDGYVIMRLVSASGNAVTADNNQAIWMSVNPSNSNWKEASAGPLLAYITPATTQGFKIIASSVNGTTELRPNHCALEITEI